MGTKGKGRKKAPEITAHSPGRQEEIPKVAKWLARSQDMGADGRRVAHLPGGVPGKALLPLLPLLLPGPYLGIFCICPDSVRQPLSLPASRQRHGGRAGGHGCFFLSTCPNWSRFHQFSWGLCRHIQSHQAVCQQLPPV